MTRNVYKYTTIGLVALLVLGCAVIATPLGHWLVSSTSIQPIDFEKVPDVWSVWTWEDGAQEAVYTSTYDSCEIAILRHGSDNQTVTVYLSMTCDHENPGMQHSTKVQGEEEYTFVTEPADFNFHPGTATECKMYIDYETEQTRDYSSILVEFHCWLPE